MEVPVSTKRFLAPTLTVYVTLALSWVGCDAGASSGGTPSCDEVCDRIATLCGSTPPDCGASCASLSSAEQRCIVDAASCESIDRCGAAEDAGGVAETDAGDVVEMDAGGVTRLDGGPPARLCAAPGATCEREDDCGVWSCQCSGGDRGRPHGLCLGGTCDDLGFNGVDRTCDFFCLPERATNARSTTQCE